MKTIKLLTLGLFISGAMLVSSCKKEGCTNPSAENYDPKAKVSDLSCTYTAEVVFWFNEATSQALNAGGVTKLNFLLNGESIGTSGTDMFWEEAPKCGAGGTIKFARTLEKASFEPFYYTVLDSEETELFSGITQLDIDSCRVIQLSGF